MNFEQIYITSLLIA